MPDSSKPGSRWRMQAFIEGERGEHGSNLIHLVSKGESVFDELAIDGLIHLEQMDDESWYVNFGGWMFYLINRGASEPDVLLMESPDDAKEQDDG